MILRNAGLSAAILGILALAQPSRGVAQSDSPVAPVLDSLMADLHERGLFNGAVLVGRDGEVLYEGGFGFANVEQGVRFTPDTPTNTSSITKTFTAAAVSMLESEGRVDFDAPATDYLPGFPYADVTVRHLLAHTSGLLPTEVYFAGLDPADETRTNELLLEILAERTPPLSFEPGSGFQYSNAAYDLAALLIERVTGASYAEFLEERIFRPLGMDSTFVRPTWNRDWVGVPTLGYRAVDGELEAFPLPDNQGDYGSNLVRSSARDLWRWTRSFYTDPVLDEPTLESGLQAPSVGSRHRSAINLLSWYHDDGGSRFHFTGVGQGFQSFAYWDAGRGHSIVWVSNKSVPLPDVLLSRALVDVMEGRTPAPVTPPDYAPLEVTSAMAWPSMEELASLSGTWTLTPSGELTIGMREGIDDLMAGWPLFARIGDGPRYHIFPVQDLLYVPGLDATVWFTEHPDGRSIHWMRLFEGRSTGTRVEP